MTARRFFSYAGAIVVGLIAGVASYTHMRQLGIDTHQGLLIASIVPLSVDGLVLVATLAIGDGRKSTFTAWLAFLIGVGVSLAANVAAADPDPLARCWSAWPSAGFLLAVEVIIRGGKRAGQLTQVREIPVVVTAPNVNTINSEPLADPDAETRKEIADLEPPKTAKPRATRNDSARDRVLKTAARMKDPTPARIAVSTRLAEATVRKHLRTANPTTGTSEPDSAGVQLDGNNEAADEPINGHSFADAST